VPRFEESEERHCEPKREKLQNWTKTVKARNGTANLGKGDSATQRDLE